MLEAAPVVRLTCMRGRNGVGSAVGLVVGVQAELDARPQDVAPPRILGESVETGECIGGDGRADPLDRVAVVVIVRRLDHHEVEHIDAVPRMIPHMPPPTWPRTFKLAYPVWPHSDPDPTRCPQVVCLSKANP